MEIPPDGWLICDGTAVSRTEFDRLFERIGETFGNGDGATTFNLPNLEGSFVRGWSAEGELDCVRDFGSYQPDQMQSHKHDDSGHKHSGETKKDGKHGHKIRLGIGDGNSEGISFKVDAKRCIVYDCLKKDGTIHCHKFITAEAKAYLGNPTDSDTGAGEPRHGDETRVKNVALRYCIKY